MVLTQSPNSFMIDCSLVMSKKIGADVLSDLSSANLILPVIASLPE
jgi:hypothetical protein